MNVKVVCDECKQEFLIGPDNLIEKEIFVENAKERLWLTFFKCPECGKQYNVIIDNRETLKLKEDLKNRMHSIDCMKKSNIPVKKIKFVALQAIKEQIGQKTEELVNIYNGSFYQCEDVKQQLEIRLPATKNAGEEENV